MKVFDVMTEAVVSELAEDTLADAASKMREQQTGSILIMEGGRLMGIFTERDLLKAVAQGKDPKLTQVKEEMTTEVVTIEPDADLQRAAELMGSRWIRHLPVIREGQVVGVLSQRDLAGVFAQSFAEQPTGELVRARRLKRIEAGDLD
jgi:CBS domain-containing protein